MNAFLDMTVRDLLREAAGIAFVTLALSLPLIGWLVRA